MHLELFTDFCANVNRFRQNEIIFVIRILTCWPENCIVDEKVFRSVPEYGQLVQRQQGGIWMEKQVKRIGVLTSGGDAPGMNYDIKR